MTRILCWLGWHRWSGYAIESDATSMTFKSRCVRCPQQKQTRAGTPDHRPARDADYWSYRAELRQAAGMADSGQMWERRHVRPLGVEEYEHWTTHTLPAGWSILRPPDELREMR
ncbi:hypothetical protein ABZY58_11585 [Micromonospora tulbaghiae]|uniref:hypothetical protein n=1 Tax=Micromonospora tulbaghiae TaxID=479978 RepID=UPI0033AED8F7